MCRNDIGRNIAESYFSKDGDLSANISPHLCQEISKTSSQEMHKKFDVETMQKLQDDVLARLIDDFDFAHILKGCITAAIYRKRSGGTGVIPQEIFHLCREKTDPHVNRWTLKHDGKAKVFVQATETTYSIMESTIVNVPLQLAIDFQQCVVTDDLGPDAAKMYKTRTDLEQIGPQTKIVWLLIKKAFVFMKPMDMVIFESARYMEDGSFMNVHASVEHPKAPINDPKKIKRIPVEWGSVIMTPLGPAQTRITFVSTIAASKFMKIIIGAAGTGGKTVKSLKKSMEATYVTEHRASISQSKTVK